jgi:hypothetical protein
MPEAGTPTVFLDPRLRPLTTMDDFGSGVKPNLQGASNGDCCGPRRSRGSSISIGFSSAWDPPKSRRHRNQARSKRRCGPDCGVARRVVDPSSDARRQIAAPAASSWWAGSSALTARIPPIGTTPSQVSSALAWLQPESESDAQPKRHCLPELNFHFIA